MDIINHIRIDLHGAAPELCADLMRRGGYEVRADEDAGNWRTGRDDAPAAADPSACTPLVRGLDRSSVQLFCERSYAAGPVIAVVMSAALDDEEVVLAVGNAHSYCLDGDPPAVVRATVRSALRRWEIETRLRAALAERDTLLQELGHRIKNTLSLAGSLISLAGSRAVNAQDAELFEESKARVHAMALLYDMLLSSGSATTVAVAPYIRALCDRIRSAFAPAQGGVAVDLRFESEAVEAELDSSKAVAVGLILNEALTNAFKYAVRPGRALSVRVGLREEDGRLKLSVRDDGPGLPAGAESGEGLGLRLIRELVAQLKGELRVESGVAGLSLAFDFPR